MKSAKFGLGGGTGCGASEEPAPDGDEISALDAAGSSEAAGSVFVFIFWVAVHVFEERFVHGGFADYVFLAGPCAQVEKFAALAAKREFGVGVRIRGLLADGAAELHALKNTANCSRARLDVVLTAEEHAPCVRWHNKAPPPSFRVFI